MFAGLETGCSHDLWVNGSFCVVVVVEQFLEHLFSRALSSDDNFNVPIWIGAAAQGKTCQANHVLGQGLNKNWLAHI
ncbi:hypothetical protein D9M72_601590 [compost metagenome]